MGQPARDKDPELAKRMIQLRKACGFKSGVEMAKFLGVGYQRWNNVELGMPLGKPLAQTIKKKVPGVDLDWLIDGDIEGLAFNVRQALATPGGMAPPPMLEPPPRTPRRR